MTTFAGLNLPENILSAITQMGYENPTPIQEEAIPPLLEGRDVVGVAQTGTGKTAAFALPMLTHVDADLHHVQALVLAPTRELAMQGAEAIDNFASNTTGLNVVAVYGGSSYVPQINAIKDGAQVVVGTPGRVMDLIDKGALKLQRVKYFVLDEADEMLRMGFAEDVEKIASGLPAQRVTALFSATMPATIRRVAQTHMSDPVEITVTPPGIDDRHYSSDLCRGSHTPQDWRARPRAGDDLRRCRPRLRAHACNSRGSRHRAEHARRSRGDTLRRRPAARPREVGRPVAPRHA